MILILSIILILTGWQHAENVCACAPFHPKVAAVPKRVSMPHRFRFELELVERGFTRIAGVDEAGRGPLAGPVLAAAVVFPVEWILGGLPEPLRKINDSKQLSAGTREILYAELVSRPEIGFGIAQADAPLIDQINILRATHRAMNLALGQLRPPPQHALVDGLPVQTLGFPHTAVVSGDALSYSIAAASILAKVSRDRLMIEYDRQYPGYGFAGHKGYGTPEHVAALKERGTLPHPPPILRPAAPGAGGVSWLTTANALAGASETMARQKSIAAPPGTRRPGGARGEKTPAKSRAEICRRQFPLQARRD